MILRTLLSLLLLAGLAMPAAAQLKGPLVLAAASLQESLSAAADSWAARGHAKPIISFASSAALARQVEAGAPADIFISADEEWMDHLDRRGLVRRASRKSFLSNRLVLIAPVGRELRLKIGRNFPLVRALGDGRLAMADPDTVPAGRYGKAALVQLGLWDAVAPRLARAENVRAALALVERGEAPAGIVYATDAKASRKVRVVGLFPAAGHPPISYPLALLKTASHRDAEPFRRFLLSRAGRAIFTRYGFGAK